MVIKGIRLSQRSLMFICAGMSERPTPQKNTPPVLFSDSIEK